MATATETLSDAELILRVRSGDQNAFAGLFDRHRDIARYVAAGQVNNTADIEDIVSEAFASIHQALMLGKGPDTFFRAYLLTVVRRIAQTQNRLAARSLPASDSLFLDQTENFEDPVLAGFESSAVAAAFKSLPERWREVLWYVDIEGMKPAETSKILGITPNGVSSLAIRAREGLRQAYLQHHIKESTGKECQGYADQLGAYSRNGLSRRAHDKVHDHLASCSKCTALLVDLNDVQSSMRAVIFPLIAGVAFTSGLPAIAGTAAGVGAIAGIGSKSMPVMLKTGAVALTGTAVIVGATIALAGTGTTIPARPGAGDLPASTQGAQATESQRTNPKSVPAASEQPTRTTSTQPTEEVPSNPYPLPALKSVQRSPANFPVPSNRLRPLPTQQPSSPGTGPATRPATRPPSELPPGTSTQTPPAIPTPSPTPSGPPTPSPTPSGPPPPSPTPSGPPTPSPTPSPSETTSPQITASFSAGPGATAADDQVTITFHIDGNTIPEAAEVIFSVQEGASLIPGKLIQPDGWSCTSRNTVARHIVCTSTAVDPDNLQFTLGITREDGTSQTTLDYRFTGIGLPSTTFSNRF